MSRLKSDLKLLAELLRSEQPIPADQMRPLAESYADACSEAARRLRMFHERVYDGRRSEAVQIAEAEPPLADLVAWLDFPEAPLWRAKCVRQQLPVAPEVDFELADELEGVYESHQSVDALLQQHRGLALARAPLSRRIAVLKALAAADPGPHWEADLKDWQTRRLVEIDGELADAAQAKRVSQLRAIGSELAAAGWRIPVPNHLGRKARHLIEIVAAETAVAALPDLAEQLAAACEQEQLAVGRQLRDDFELRLREAAPLTRDGGAAADTVQRAEARAAESVAWLDAMTDYENDRDRRNELAAQVEASLRNDDDLEQLTATRERAVAGGAVLDQTVEAEYQARVDRLQRDRNRRKIAVVVGSVAALALLMTISWLGYNAVEHGRRVKGVVAATQADFDRGDLDAAQARLQDVPDLHAEPPVAEQLQQLAAGLEERGQRRQELATITSQLTASESRAAAQTLYEQGLTKLDPEGTGERTAQLTALQTAQTTATDRLAAIRDGLKAEFATAFEAAKGLVAQLEDATSDRQFETLVEEVEPQLTTATRVGQLLDADGGALHGGQVRRLREQLSRLFRDRTAAQQWQALARTLSDRALLESDPAAAGGSQSSLDPFVALLQTAAGDKDAALRAGEDIAVPPGLPDHLVRQLKAAAESETLWQTVLRQQVELAAFEGPIVSAQDANSRTETLEAVLGREVVADRALIERYADYAESYGDRFSPRGPFNASLQFLRTPVIAEVVELRTGDGRRYFAPEEMRREEKLTNRLMHYRTVSSDAKPEQAQPGLLRAKQTPFVQKRLAPQVGLAKDLRAELEPVGTGRGDWNETFERIVTRIRRTPDLPPALRATMMLRLLTEAGDGDSELETALQPAIDAFESRNWDTLANWIDPGYEPGRNATERINGEAERLLIRLPELRPLFRSGRDRVGDLEAAMAARYRPVGVVLPVRRSGPNRVLLGQPSGVDAASGLQPAESHESLMLLLADGDSARWEPVSPSGDNLASRAGLLVFERRGGGE